MAAVITTSLSTPRLSPGMLALVLLAHGGVLLAILATRDAYEPIVQMHALTVSLIEHVQESPGPAPQPPRRVPKRPKQAPVLATERSIEPAKAPQVIEVSRQIVETPPAVIPAPAEAVAPAKATVAGPPVIEPRHDADYLDNPRPAYPLISRRMGEQGVVQLRVYVNADGSVEKLELKRSSGHTRLDQSAMSAVRDWRFVPARQGNQATAAWVVVPIQFTFGS